jgi:hypothetical protein
MNTDVESRVVSSEEGIAHRKCNWLPGATSGRVAARHRDQESTGPVRCRTSLYPTEKQCWVEKPYSDLGMRH